MQYWLMKSEPNVYCVDDLAAEPGGTALWEGVRNYQARNFLRSMRKGDLAFFYHSNCAQPAVVGIVEIARESYPDPTAFDADSAYYDPKSDPENPRWFVVDVKFKKKFERAVTLKALKSESALGTMRLVQRGNRLSVMPVTRKEWHHIVKMSQ